MPVRGNCDVSGWSLNSGKGIEGTGPVDGTAGEETSTQAVVEKKEGNEGGANDTDLSTYEVVEGREWMII